MKILYTLILSIIMVFLIIPGIGQCSQLPEQRICTVDINLIFQKSEAEKNAKLKLESKQKEMTKILNEEKIEIDKLSENLQRESMVMNTKAIEKKERDIRIKINDLKSLKTKLQKELDNFQEKLLSDMEEEIVRIVSMITDLEGYSLAINKSAILYSKHSIDITDKVLNEYNKK